MKHNLFVHAGRAIILKDIQQDNYVGLAYVTRKDGKPEFASFAAKVSKDSPYQYTMLYIIQSLTVGMQERGVPIEDPIPLRDCNRAMITGDGGHYAIGVQNGKLHYTCAEEGFVSDAMMAMALAKKMRCPDR